MQVEILYRPSYSLARVLLDPNEIIQAETGSMVAMSAGVQMDTFMRGGLLQSLARSALGGESFLTNSFRAPSTGGEVMLAPLLSGDILSLNLSGEILLVHSGSFLACSDGITVDTKWSGAKTFFGGEGLIMLRCSGTGTLILSSYGAIHEINLRPGEVMTVDTGHLVAFSEQIGFDVHTLGGLRTAFLSGEGLVVDLTGAGRLLLQTRSQGAFLDWLLSKIPKQNE